MTGNFKNGQLQKASEFGVSLTFTFTVAACPVPLPLCHSANQIYLPVLPQFVLSGTMAIVNGPAAATSTCVWSVGIPIQRSQVI